MSQIRVSDLSFYYEGSYEEIFKNVSLSIDTNWKLGFVGRNGRGKTTFLNLLMGKYEYAGSISSPEPFDYFPFAVPDPSQDTIDVVEAFDPQCESWKLFRELNLLEVGADVLYRPFATLSSGERTKVMLAVLFLRENHFLLIDEPTNHLDAGARETVSRYLNRKSGFILVSHDRQFMDGCIDHVLALNRHTIEVVQGNFTSWWENKRRRDESEARENEKLKKEIVRLKEAARRAEHWSDEVEKTKVGTRIAGLRPDRGAIGHKAAKMMKRAKSTETRMERAAGEKEKLLKDVEAVEALKILPLAHHKEVLAAFEDVALGYGDSGRAVLDHLSFTVKRGDRVALCGRNGCGKSTVLLALLAVAAGKAGGEMPGREASGGRIQGTAGVKGTGALPAAAPPALLRGKIETAAGLVISYVSQDTSWLSGSMERFMELWGLEPALFLAILRKLDFSRTHFDKEMQYYSEGQKKKVLLAKSLCERAHLYIWDEPLNFIDIFSRMQIEELIRRHRLTMIFVEHDQAFRDEIATQTMFLN